MIMAACQPGDKIIMPRNVHKSALGGLILSGAQPLYVEPEVDTSFGISLGVNPQKIKWVLQQHPDAKAVFVINPNYYGTTSNLAEIVNIAHSKGVPVLVDEAHGAHFKFHPDLPVSAIEAKADLVASSTHKLIGSLTQSSILLLRKGLISEKVVKRVLNLTQTTSPSYILLSSIDVARKQMALKGYELLSNTLLLAKWLRDEIKEIQGIRLLEEEEIAGSGCFDFDPTKVTVNVTGWGITGYEAEKILRTQYNIQVELSDLYNVMFLVTIGDTWESVRYLSTCLKEMASRKLNSKVIKLCPPLPEIPQMVVSPREAFYSQTKSVKLEEAIGEISAEAIMVYPPGIPLICPGERITRDIVGYITILKEEKADLQGMEDHELSSIKVLKRTGIKTSHVITI